MLSNHLGKLFLHVDYFTAFLWLYWRWLEHIWWIFFPGLHAAIILFPAQIVHEIIDILDVPRNFPVVQQTILKEYRIQILALRLYLLAITWHLILVALQLLVQPLLKLLLLLAERIETASALLKASLPIALG